VRSLVVCKETGSGPDGAPLSQASRNTVRTARSGANIGTCEICRIFLRLVLLWVIDRQEMVTDRAHKYRPLIDRLEICCLAAVVCSF
jgi:hypothetical protein